MAASEGAIDAAAVSTAVSSTADVRAQRRATHIQSRAGTHATAREKGALVETTVTEEFDVKDFLARGGSGKRILEYRKNQTIFVQGEAADAVFYIQKGSVKLTVVSPRGKEAVVGILQAGQFFGENCLDPPALHVATTTAMERCLVTSITKAAMLVALQSHRGFSDLFMGYLLNRNSRVAEDLIDLLLNSSERRLARLLVRLAKIGGEGRSQIIPMLLSQEDLADMIGTTRSRVSFFMNKFRKLGLIDYNGRIEVHRALADAILNDRPAIASRADKLRAPAVFGSQNRSSA
jgi:CRP/FNR family transcriptional regulator, cyclic AMP receptor protein